MKNLIKNQDAVAYLLLVGVGLTLIITGITYNFVSDFLDMILGAINNYSGTPLANSMDAEGIEGGNFLLLMFKMTLVPSLIAIMYFAWSMSQKPVKSW